MANLEKQKQSKQKESVANKGTESHHYDALAISCIDGDYFQANLAFFKHLGLRRVDEIKLAGGPKNLVDPEKPSHYETINDQIAKSLKLHGQSDNFPIFLIWHQKCGAFNFQDTEELYEEQMLKAVNLLPKPTHLIMAQVSQRLPDGKPKIVTYSTYTPNGNGLLEKNEIFTYYSDN